MTINSTTSPAPQSGAETTVHLLDDWFDPIEAELRDRVREFIQAMIESELEAALVRPRYGRRPKADAKNGSAPEGISGHRHGHRSRSLLNGGLIRQQQDGQYRRSKSAGSTASSASRSACRNGSSGISG